MSEIEYSTSKKQAAKKFSKYGDSDNIYPHKHCPTCNKIIDETEEFCSVECGTFDKKKDKKSKKKLFGFIGVYVVVVIVFIVVAFV